MKYTVSRMDAISRKKYPLSILLRFKIEGDLLIYDEDKTLKGRGLYILNDSSSLETLRKKKVSSRYIKNQDDINLIIQTLERIGGVKK